MVLGFLRRGGGADTLEADLKRVTESSVIEVPKELLDNVTRASGGQDERVEIMRHLRDCLSESHGKRWRRIYAGLLLVEALIKNGAPQLLVETAEGQHFDLVQRLTFLDQFECTADRRAQTMIRNKAKALRHEIVPLLNDKSMGTAIDTKRDYTSSTSSPCTPSLASCSTTSTGYSSAATTAATGPPLVLNGIVSVGHRDDTTSEESGDERARRPAPPHAKSTTGGGAARAQRRPQRGAPSGDSTDSDSTPKGARQKKPPVSRSPQAASTETTASVDLLGL